MKKKPVKKTKKKEVVEQEDNQELLEVERDDKGRFLKGFPAKNIKNAGRKGWWDANKEGTEKLAKLELAFSFGATDIEAVAFADITLENLYYYQRKNPDFKTKKKALKSKVLFLARKNVVDRVKFENAKNESDIEKLSIPADNSWRYLKSHSDEFADRVDPDIGRKLGNDIRFVNFEKNDGDDDED